MFLGQPKLGAPSKDLVARDWRQSLAVCNLALNSVVVLKAQRSSQVKRVSVIFCSLWLTFILLRQSVGFYVRFIIQQVKLQTRCRISGSFTLELKHKRKWKTSAPDFTLKLLLHDSSNNCDLKCFRSICPCIWLHFVKLHQTSTQFLGKF